MPRFKVGEKLGLYEILAPIGAGGMGEVYRARDPKLDREVAIKVLPENLAGDAERLGRFEREARVLASLNHPNIAQIYGVEERALVMELVEGPTLADRIKQGPIPAEEAQTILLQMADALEYAHERGVIHRDLKPANIKIDPEDKVKILDFGLAKALTDPLSSNVSDPTQSPTLTMGATVVGTILGTASYMAPEQARGKKVDKRADIWAFGAVVYEMLTGGRLFDAEDTMHAIGKVLEQPIELDRVPPKFRKLLWRCLDRNPKDRLRDIGEVRFLLAEPASSAAPEPLPASRRRSRWIFAGAAIVAVLGLGAGAGMHFTGHTAPLPVVRFTVLPPDGGAFPGNTPRIAISPDGTMLAFQSLGSQGKPQIWIRRFDSTEAQPLPGTEGAVTPFWSADSRFVGFFADGKLKRAEAGGGPAQIICDGPTTDSNGTWNRDGVILFSGRDSANPVMRVMASGGTPAPVTKLAKGEQIQRWPRFLPDGRHFLYFSTFDDPNQNGTFVSSIDGMPPKRILTSQFMADYASGYLLYRVDRALMARPFDVNKLELSGEQVQVTPSVGVLANNGRVGFSVSNNGYMAFSEISNGDVTHMVWLDRSGKQIGDVGEPGYFGEPRLSPDGKQVAVTRIESGVDAVWLVDLARGVPSKFASGPSGRGRRYPVWSPDGRTIFLNAGGFGESALYSKDVSGLSEEQLLLKDSSGALVPQDVSPDGKALTYHRSTGGNFDLYALPLEGGPGTKKPEPFAVQATPSNETQARFSADGHWLAFASDESGQSEVFVRSYPGKERKIPISPAPEAGSEPQWRRDGKELYYVSQDSNGVRRLMMVPIRSLNPFEAGTPTALFTLPAFSSLPTESHYAASADGSKFLFLAPVARPQAQRIIVVQNWTAALRAK